MANDPRRPRRPRQRQQVSDIERFLQEVDRLRRKAAEDAQRAERAEPVEEVLEVQEVLPASPPPRPRRVADDEAVDEVVVLPEPVQRSYTIEPPPMRYAPSPQPAVPQLEVPPPSLQAKLGSVAEARSSPPSERRKATVSPAARTLMNLLRSKQNVQAAILVREILDPPLCRRKR